MLDKDIVLNHVKLNLGFPYKAIEHSDDLLYDYICKYTIPFFSSYVPDKARINIDNSFKAPNDTYFLINDPDGCSILAIQDVIQDASISFLTNHPITPILSFENLSETYLNISKSRMTSQLMKTTFEWIPPNKLYLYPNTYGLSGSYMIRYLRTHPITFYTIPVIFQSIFLDLATSHCLEMIASIRSTYTNLNTPFGEININADALISRATDLKNGALEKLNTIPPSVIVEIG